MNQINFNTTRAHAKPLHNNNKMVVKNIYVHKLSLGF